ncbi:MAG: sugar phosphate isomerase/epimerase family protein [Planctomycetota bacterium]
MTASAPHLTVLNSMAGTDFADALDTHVEWGLRVLDLKNAIFGKPVMELTDREAERAAGMIAERGLTVHCLSTGLFNEAVEAGEETFREEHLGRVDRAVEIGNALDARTVRLLAASTERRDEVLHSFLYLQQEAPWLFDLYAAAVDRLGEEGFKVVIENEVGGCIFSRPCEVPAFFERLDRPAARLTWDVQNLWQMGTFPTPEIYHELEPLIGMLHLKGGRSEVAGGLLKWRAYLEDSSYPVLPIVRAAVAGGACSAVCLNPPHGEDSPDYDWDYRRDIEFLRANVPELA